MKGNLIQVMVGGVFLTIGTPIQAIQRCESGECYRVVCGGNSNEAGRNCQEECKSRG